MIFLILNTTSFKYIGHISKDVKARMFTEWLHALIWCHRPFFMFYLKSCIGIWNIVFWIIKLTDALASGFRGKKIKSQAPARIYHKFLVSWLRRFVSQYELDFNSMQIKWYSAELVLHHFNKIAVMTLTYVLWGRGSWVQTDVHVWILILNLLRALRRRKRLWGNLHKLRSSYMVCKVPNPESSCEGSTTHLLFSEKACVQELAGLSIILTHRV